MDQALALYHYLARLYDFVAGRFCSRDPIYYYGSPYNLFEYVSASPLNHSDPSGEVKCSTCNKIQIGCHILATAGCIECLFHCSHWSWMCGPHAMTCCLAFCAADCAILHTACYIIGTECRKDCEPDDCEEGGDGPEPTPDPVPDSPPKIA